MAEKKSETSIALEENLLVAYEVPAQDNIIRAASHVAFLFLAALVAYMAFQAYRFGSGMKQLLLFVPPFLLYLFSLWYKPAPKQVRFTSWGISPGDSRSITWDEIVGYVLDLEGRDQDGMLTIEYRHGADGDHAVRSEKISALEIRLQRRDAGKVEELFAALAIPMKTASGTAQARG